MNKTKKILALGCLLLVALPLTACGKCKHAETTITGQIEATCSSTGYTGDVVCVKCEEIVTPGTTIAALAHTTEVVDAKEATCTEDGFTGNQVCSVCNAIIEEGEVIPKLNHEGELVNVQEATCLAKGYTGDRICSKCGEQYETGTVIDIVDHAWEEKELLKAATCKQEGKHIVVCKFCQAEMEEVIPKKEHNIVVDPGLSATCTTAGKTEGRHCTICNEVIEKQQNIPALGHEVVVESQGTAATCVKDGVASVSRCTRCNKTLTNGEVIRATGHKPQVTPEVAATCDTAGKTESSVCSVCKTVLKESVSIPAKGHTEVQDSAVQATCTAAGKTGGSHCSTCNKVMSQPQTIPALGHTTTKKNDTPATCIEDGKTGDVVCTRCNTVVTPGTVIKALGHKSVEVNNGRTPTCTEAGKESDKKCTVCNAITYEGKEIPMLEHKPVSKDNAIEATCTEDGKEADTICSVCMQVLEEGKVIDMLGHDGVEADNGKEATCSEPGREPDIVCSRCEELLEEGKEIPALEHTPVEADNAVAPTCLRDGKETDIICSVCETVLEAGKTIARLPHTLKQDENAVDPTCETIGLTESTSCSTCGLIVTPQQEIPALGHIEKTIDAIAPTCTENGRSESIICERCNKVLKESDVVPATGHNQIRDNSGKDATCTENGKDDNIVCSVCGTVIAEGEVIEALGHELVDIKEIPATCTRVGYTAGKECSRCGEQTVPVQEIPMKEHSPIDGTPIEATCEKGGKTAGTICSVCNTVLTEGEDTEPLGHDIKTDPEIPATCTETGRTARIYCSRCSYVEQESTVIDVIAHTPVFGGTEGCHEKCSVCGAELNANHSFTDEILEEATCQKEGLVKHTCECGYFTEEPIQITDHVIEDVEAVAATCTTPGTTAGSRCKFCDTQNVGINTVPALGHDYDSNSIDMVLMSKDDDTLQVKFTCNRCNEVEEVTGTISDKNIIEEPTCSKEGKMTCKVTATPSTGEITINSTFTLNKTAHTEEEIKAVEATCTSKGSTAGVKCSVCGEILVAPQNIPYAHTYKQLTTDDIVWSTENDSQCTVTLTCEKCGATETLNGVANNKVIESATCTEKGLMTCTIACQNDNVQCTVDYSEELAPLGHELESANLVVKYDAEASEATATVEGKCVHCDATVPVKFTGEVTLQRAPECERLGEYSYTTISYTLPTRSGISVNREIVPAEGGEYPTIPALGHNFKDGVCTRCNCVPALAINTNWYKGSVDKSEITSIVFTDSIGESGYKEAWAADNIDGMMYKAYLLSDNKTVIISGEGKTSIVANKYAGMFDGFVKLEEIQNLTMLDTSKTVELNKMFNGCKALTYLDLSSFDTSKVTSMTYTFANCETLKTILVGDNWTTAKVPNTEDPHGGSNPTPDYGTFSGCTSLVGGAGTAYDSSKTVALYARVDSEDAPGYLTLKTEAPAQP